MSPLDGRHAYRGAWLKAGRNRYYHGRMTAITKVDAVISAGEFKAKCLKLLDHVSQTHQALTITKRGRPVARLVPLEAVKPRRLHGFLTGHIVEAGDIVAPTDEAWETNAE